MADGNYCIFDRKRFITNDIDEWINFAKYKNLILSTNEEYQKEAKRHLIKIDT